MSRENSLEDLTAAGSSSYNQPLAAPTSHRASLISSLPSSQFQMDSMSQAGPSRTPNRRASKSVSHRPGALTPKRTASYYSSGSPSASLSAHSPSGPSPRLRPDGGLKRRISTPLISKLALDEGDDVSGQAGPSGGGSIWQSGGTTGQMVKGKEGHKGSLQQSGAGSNVNNSRARSTSTSIVVPSTLPLPEPTIAVDPPAARPKTSSGMSRPHPPPSLVLVPSTPPETAFEPAPPAGLLTSIYNLGESSMKRISSLVSAPPRAHAYHMQRRISEDSEKGLELLEDESSSVGTTRASTDVDDAPRRGKYYGAWTGAKEDDGYFSLPPTPPEGEVGDNEKQLAFGEALARAGKGGFASLPTPALSAHSLSHAHTPARGWGWWSNLIARLQWDAKTGAVVRELGWTVAVLVIGFCVTLGMVVAFLGGLPITTLKHLPKSTTDVQLLSAEIRDYMEASSFGWYHTVGVLTFIGCWKHAWSVPGAVVLNILVGTLLSPIPALGLLTIITATGSLGSYCLSRPLAPLIAVLFPKPLALVRAALAPDSAPPPNLHRKEMGVEHVSPVNLGTTPIETPQTNQSTAIWRRLLIMRAMGIVPWSGMNVACGVVGVDWRVFWLTTAAGSASWSYVTASVGDILSRLAIPKEGEDTEGESIASLLRDPVLIAKLVFLTGLTLIPVLLKKNKGQADKESVVEKDGLLSPGGESPTSPSSPLASSVSRFTPTPAVFDLLSFGRTVGRTAGRWRWVGGVNRVVGSAWGRVVGQVQ